SRAIPVSRYFLKGTFRAALKCSSWTRSSCRYGLFGSTTTLTGADDPPLFTLFSTSTFGLEAVGSACSIGGEVGVYSPLVSMIWGGRARLVGCDTEDGGGSLLTDDTGST